MSETSAEIPPDRTLALLVAVERYEKYRLKSIDLDGPAHDVLRLVEWLLERGVPSRNISVLATPLESNQSIFGKLNETLKKEGREEITLSIGEVTRDVVLTHLEKLAKPENGMLFLFWSGHGLMTADQNRHPYYSNFHESDKSTLDVESLLKHLQTQERSYPCRQILIFDTCSVMFDEIAFRESIPKATFPEGPVADPLRSQFVLHAAASGQRVMNNTEKQSSEYCRELLDVLRGDFYWPPDFRAVFQLIEERFRKLRESNETTLRPVYQCRRDSSGNKSGWSRLGPDQIGDDDDPDVMVRSAGGTRVVDNPFIITNFFEDRVEDREKLRLLLREPKWKLICVLGRNGLGKTSLLCKTLEELGQANGESAGQSFNGVAYVRCEKSKNLTLDRLLRSAARMLPAETTALLLRSWRSQSMSPEARVLSLLNQMQTRRFILALDQFEDLLAPNETVADADLRIFFENVLKSPSQLTVILTTQILPDFGVTTPARQNIELKCGLPSGDGVTVLRNLDGERFAAESDEVLRLASERCNGNPRALERLAGDMAKQPGLALAEYLKRIEFVKDVLEFVTAEHYELLTEVERQGMNALSVLGCESSTVAVAALLDPLPPSEVQSLLYQLARR